MDMRTEKVELLQSRKAESKVFSKKFVEEIDLNKQRKKPYLMPRDRPLLGWKKSK